MVQLPGRMAPGRCGGATEQVADAGEFPSPDGNQRVTAHAAAGFPCLHLSEGATRGVWQQLICAVSNDGTPNDAYRRALGPRAKDVAESFARLLHSL